MKREPSPRCPCARERKLKSYRGDGVDKNSRFPRILTFRGGEVATDVSDKDRREECTREDGGKRSMAEKKRRPFIGLCSVSISVHGER